MTSIRLAAIAFVLGSMTPYAQAQQDGATQDSASWLPSLITETPQEGFELAVMLARRGVATTQPDREILRAGRPKYSDDPDSLIAASEVIAIHFGTIAAANDYWRDRSEEE